MNSQITIPSPRTWAPGDLVTAPRLRADAADAVAFLAARPAFVGQNTTGASLAAGSDLALPLNAELLDSWNGHSTASGLSSQYFAQVPGWYLCRSSVAFALFSSPTEAATAGGFTGRSGGVSYSQVRGAQCLVNANGQLLAQACDLILQTVTGKVGGGGDYIQPTAFQGSGSPLALATGPLAPSVSMRWVCAATGVPSLPVPPLTPVPSPVTSAWLNANVRDAISFLTWPPIARAHYTAGSSSLASSLFPAGNVVPVNTPDIDTYVGLTLGSNAGYTAQVAGRYWVYGQFNLTGNAVTTGYYAGLCVNGGTVMWGDGTFNSLSGGALGNGAQVGRYLRLAAGDKVQLMGAQNSGSAIPYATAAGNETRLIVVWTGA